MSKTNDMDTSHKLQQKMMKMLFSGIRQSKLIKKWRPTDLILLGKEVKWSRCLHIDMPVRTAWNTLLDNYRKKLSKYKDLQIEIERIGSLKVTSKPIVTVALGFVKKGMEN